MPTYDGKGYRTQQCQGQPGHTGERVPASLTSVVMDLLYKTGLTGGEALTGLGSMTAMGMLGLQNNIE